MLKENQNFSISTLSDCIELSLFPKFNVDSLTEVMILAIESAKSSSTKNLIIVLPLNLWLEIHESGNNEVTKDFIQLRKFEKIAWLILDKYDVGAILNPTIFSDSLYNIHEHIFTEINQALNWFKQSDNFLRELYNRFVLNASLALKAGTNHADTSHLRLKIAISNIIYTVFFFSTLVTMLWDLPSLYIGFISFNPGVWYSILLLVVIAFSHFLNFKGKSFFGRVLFLIVWTSSVVLFPILLGTQSSYYFTYGLAIITTSMIIQLLFSFEVEKVSFLLMMGLSLVGVLYYIDFLFYFDRNAVTEIQHIATSITRKGVMFWFILNTITFGLLAIFNQMYNKNQMMRQAYKSWNINLEKAIDEKTANLVMKNKQLKEYAFHNSHTLRGAFCRLKGLMILQETKNAEFDEELVTAYINTSIDELEQVIEEMQKVTNL